MPKVEATKRFKRAFKKKPKQMREKITRALQLLEKDPWYPGLETHPMGGRKGVFESYIDGSNRITWEWANEDDTIRLRMNCNHDMLYKNP